MKSNRGSLLYESLFSFMLFISVVILIVSLYSSLNKGRTMIIQDYQIINNKEKSLSSKDLYQEVIEMVLP